MGGVKVAGERGGGASEPKRREGRRSMQLSSEQPALLADDESNSKWSASLIGESNMYAVINACKFEQSNRRRR